MWDAPNISQRALESRRSARLAVSRTERHREFKTSRLGRFLPPPSQKPEIVARPLMARRESQDRLQNSLGGLGIAAFQQNNVAQGDVKLDDLRLPPDRRLEDFACAGIILVGHQ